MRFKYVYKNHRINVFIAGKNGGRGKCFVFGESWEYKGYWIIYHSYNGYLYRIWTTTKEKAEIKAWVRWFNSSSFKKEHELFVNSENYNFYTMPDWNSVPIGFRKSGLPDNWFGDWYKNKGYIIQIYTPKQIKEKEVLSIRKGD